jgi:hypothetical protein
MLPQRSFVVHLQDLLDVFTQRIIEVTRDRVESESGTALALAPDTHCPLPTAHCYYHCSPGEEIQQLFAGVNRSFMNHVDAQFTQLGCILFKLSLVVQLGHLFVVNRGVIIP